METTKACGSCKHQKKLSEFRMVKEKRASSPFEYPCSICRECERLRALQRYHLKKEECQSSNKLYKANNKDKINATRRRYVKEKMQSIEYKLTCNMKSLISAKLAKTRHTGEYLGAPMQLIVKWIESNFDDMMSWDNYGSAWQIDHTLPIKCFDLSDETEALTCFCWMNLMPLETSKNARKAHHINMFRVYQQEQRLKLFAQREHIQEQVQEFLIKYVRKIRSLLICNMTKLREPPKSLCYHSI